MRGRKPKPTKMKLLQGNPGGRPLNDSEPQPESSIPRCPRHLVGSARAEWRRITPELHRLGILTVIDVAALAGYCTVYGRYVIAEQHLKTEGDMIYSSPKGYSIQSPWVGISNMALEHMRKYLIEFGMTPSSRSRIHVAKKESDNSEKFLFGKAN